MAQIRLVDAQGNPVVADENNLQSVFESGEAGFGAQVEMVGADGGRYSAAAADVPGLLRDGVARLATHDELSHEEALQAADEGLANNAAAQAAEFARGATFGASDYAIEGLGIASKEKLQLLREANADETGVAGFAGAVLPSLALGAVTGGVGAGWGLAGRVGAQAAIQGAAGAADAALRVVNDDWLRDEEISAERVLAGAGEGFALGALFGAGGELIAAGAKAATKAAAKAMAPENAANLAVDAVVGGYDKVEKGLILRGFGDDAGRQDLGNLILQENVLGRTSAESLDNVIAAKERIGADLASAYRQIDDLGVQPDVRRLRKSLFEHAEKVSEVAPDVADSIRSRVQGLADALYDTKPVRKALDDMAASEAWIDLGASPAARKAKLRFDKLRNSDLAEVDVLDALQRDKILSAAFPDEIGRVAEAQAGAGARALSVSDVWELRKQWDELRNTLAPTNVPARKALQDARDDFMGAFFDDLRAKAPAEMVDQIGEHGKRYKAMLVAEEGLSRQASAVTRRAGDFGLGSAAAGAVGGLALGAGAAGGALFGAALQAGGVYAKDAARQGLPRLFKAAAKAEERFGTFADRMLGKVGPMERMGAKAAAMTLPRAMTNADIDKRRESLELAAADDSPETIAAQAADPQLGPAIAKQQQRVAQYLLDRLPKGKDPIRDIWARFTDPHYSEADRREYARVERAALDPTAVIEDLVAGRARPVEVETVRELYPRLMERAQQQLLASIAALPARPSAAQRRAVERFLGPSAGRNPALLTWLQKTAKTAAAARQQEQAQAGGGGAAPAAEMDYAAGYGGVSDRLQAGIGQQ